MKELVVEKVWDSENFKGRFLTKDMVDTWFDESVKLVTSEGELVAIFERGAMDPNHIKLAWQQIKNWNPKTNNRGTSTGAHQIQRVRKDGKVSKTRVVPDEEMAISGVMGFYDRYPRIPYCRKCAWNMDNPDKWEKMLPLIQAMDRWQAKHWPLTYEVMKAEADKTHPDFLIPGTSYTTVTINKNYRTACHLDPKNLPGAHSAMCYIQQGKLLGGDLIFPEYRAGFKFKTGDAIIFNNQGAWHGNSAITKLTKDAVRCTLVFYFRAGMIHCGSAAEELEIAKHRQRGDHLND